MVRHAIGELRAEFDRLLFFAAFIALGVAFVTGTGSLCTEVRFAIHQNGRDLLGGDLVIRTSRPLTEPEQRYLDTVASAIATDMAVATMAEFPAAHTAREVQLHAVSARFPLAGTAFPRVPASTPNGVRPALIQASLAESLHVHVDDRIRMAGVDFRVAGIFASTPDELLNLSRFDPAIYVASADLPNGFAKTNRNRSTIKTYLALSADTDAERVGIQLQDGIADPAYHFETVARLYRGTDRILDKVNIFLSIAGLAAWGLGVLTILALVRVEQEAKRATISTLRCIGAAQGHIFGAYLLKQGVVFGIGAGVGICGGIFLHSGVMIFGARLLPMALPSHSTVDLWRRGLVAGAAMPLAFSAALLWQCCRVRPMIYWRDDADATIAARWGRWMPALGLAAIALLAMWEVRHPGLGLILIVGTAVGIAFVAGLLRLGRIALSRASDHLGFAIRCGLGGLIREGNLTLLLVAAVGLSCCAVLTLSFAELSLRHNYDASDDGGSSEVVLLDVDPAQLQTIKHHVTDCGGVLRRLDPAVPMWLQSLDLAPGGRWDRFRSLPDPSLARRVFLATYSIEADAAASSDAGMADEIPISIDQSFARRGVARDDKLVWNVGGVRLRTRVASIHGDEGKPFRKFPVEFPPGVLESAPQTYVATISALHGADRLTSVLAEACPTVLAMDLTVQRATIGRHFRDVARLCYALTLLASAVAISMVIGIVVYTRRRRSHQATVVMALGGPRRAVALASALEWGVIGILGAGLGATGAWFLSDYIALQLLNVDSVRPLPYVAAAIAVAGAGCAIVAAADTYVRRAGATDAFRTLAFT